MDPKDTPVPIADRFARGVACFRNGDGMGAVRDLESVIEEDPAYRHPDGDNAYFYLGKIHEVENRLETAVQLYSQALSLDPWDEESLIGRGSCRTVLKRHPEAIADFQKALGIPDTHRRAPAGHLLYAIAENMRQSERFREALEWGQKALEADPGNFRHRELVKTVAEKLAAEPKET
jgi:tetratricopeptide (TPR) repeat protein